MGHADEDPMQDFGVTAPGGERREATSRRRRHRKVEEYMKSIRRGFLGGVYVE